MFQAEFCRRHGWAKEEPLEVVVELGGRGGGLNAVEKARRVMGERLGSVRTWEELPVSLAGVLWRVRGDPCSNARFDAAIGSSCSRSDGGPAACFSALSLRLRLSCVKRTSHRLQSAQDAHMRTCHCSGIIQSSHQRRVRDLSPCSKSHAEYPGAGRPSVRTALSRPVNKLHIDCSSELVVVCITDMCHLQCI